MMRYNSEVCRSSSSRASSDRFTSVRMNDMNLCKVKSIFGVQESSGILLSSSSDAETKDGDVGPGDMAVTGRGVVIVNDCCVFCDVLISAWWRL